MIRCFVSVFNPFLMGGLLFAKILIPILTTGILFSSLFQVKQMLIINTWPRDLLLAKIPILSYHMDS